MPSVSRETSETVVWYKRPEYWTLFFVGLVYLVLIGRYRAWDLDDVWFLSFSRQFWVHHIQTDTFALGVFPNGMGGVIAFGKLAAFVQGTVLSVAGWSMAAGILLSIVFVLLSLALLADVVRCNGYDSKFVACFIALTGLTESVVVAAEKARYEFLTFFFLALALWLASRRSILFAMFVGALATEIEPAGSVVPFAIFVAVLIYSKRNSVPLGKILVRSFTGVAVAVFVYFALHPHAFAVLHAAQWGTMNTLKTPGGFVTAYYLKLKRHVPELFLLLAAIAVAALRHRRILLDWPALCGLTILLFSSILRWGNPNYFCLMSPFVCLFILQAFYSERRWKWILAAILLYTLPQYAYRFHHWRSLHAGFSQRQENQVTGSLDRASAAIGKSPEEVHVIGNYEIWFAHPDNFVSLADGVVTAPMMQNTDLIVCFDQVLDQVLTGPDRVELPCSSLSGVRARVVDRLNLNGYTLQVLAPEHTPQLGSAPTSSGSTSTTVGRERSSGSDKL